MKTESIGLLAVGACIVVAGLLWRLYDSPPGQEPSIAAPAVDEELAKASDPATRVEATDSLEKMETVFVGGFSRAAIKARIDPVMTQYGLVLTEDNYSRSGSVLVKMRGESGISEMELLKCMIGARPEGVNLEFPAGAALCAWMMSGRGAKP